MKFIYLCGPTVYDKVHIGNMRPIITFDITIRATKQLGENVTLIHNITDIDDKIVAKSLETKISEQEISKKYFEFYKEMLISFNVNTIIEMPTVSDNIDIIIPIIEKLITKKNAYISNSVYFDTKSISSYGEISNRKLDNFQNLELIDDNKKNPEDFVLWKLKSEGLTWDSPWGKGRPGWHTECLAFIEEYGQADIDIHGGGIDLKFPHHENENAQFVALHGKPITKNWIHIGIMNLNGQKMSKSEHNILYADDFLRMESPFNLNNADVFRLLILNSNYKNVIEFNEYLYLETAKKLHSIIKIFNLLSIEENYVFSKIDDIAKILEYVKEWNFSLAMKEINEKIKLFNQEKNISIGNQIISFFKILGFRFPEKIISEEDKNIYQLWKKESRLKNWKRADELREQLSHILG